MPLLLMLSSLAPVFVRLCRPMIVFSALFPLFPHPAITPQSAIRMYIFLIDFLTCDYIAVIPNKLSLSS
jgi:hypothetical protein